MKITMRLILTKQGLGSDKLFIVSEKFSQAYDNYYGYLHFIEDCYLSYCFLIGRNKGVDSSEKIEIDLSCKPKADKDYQEIIDDFLKYYNNISIAEALGILEV